jgi:SAM-dependent methyltransferase
MNTSNAVVSINNKHIPQRSDVKITTDNIPEAANDNIAHETPRWFGPKGKRSKGRGHPVMFGFRDAEHFEPFPDGGGYPLRFLARAFDSLRVTDPSKVLHLCSGSMQTGVRVDIRPEVRPTVVCDCRNTPFPDESFDWIMVDPPYNPEYAQNLYGTGEHYPAPAQILREASRLLRPRGRVGFLHFQVPMFRRPLSLINVTGITTGCGYNIRAWTVLEKLPEPANDNCGPVNQQRFVSGRGSASTGGRNVKWVDGFRQR